MRSQLTFHCSLHRPRRMRTNSRPLSPPSPLSSLPRWPKEGRKVIPARSYFTPSLCLLLLPPLPSLLLSSACLLLSIYLCVSLSLLSPCLCLSLSFPLSWCKVMEAGVCGSRRARLRDYTARSHERFMMLGSVCVCVSPSRSGSDWKKGTRRDGEKRKEGGGMEGTECETN